MHGNTSHKYCEAVVGLYIATKDNLKVCDESDMFVISHTEQYAANDSFINYPFGDRTVYPNSKCF